MEQLRTSCGTGPATAARAGQGPCCSCLKETWIIAPRGMRALLGKQGQLSSVGSSLQRDGQAAQAWAVSINVFSSEDFRIFFSCGLLPSVSQHLPFSLTPLNYVRSQNIWPEKHTSCKNNQYHHRFLALHASSTQPGVKRRSPGRSKAPSFNLYIPSELYPWRRSPQGNRRAARALPVRTHWKVKSGKDRWSLQVDLIVGRIEVHSANSLLCSPMGAEPGRGQVLVSPGLVMVFTGQTSPAGHLLIEILTE